MSKNLEVPELDVDQFLAHQGGMPPWLAKGKNDKAKPVVIEHKPTAELVDKHGHQVAKPGNPFTKSNVAKGKKAVPAFITDTPLSNLPKK